MHRRTNELFQVRFAFCNLSVWRRPINLSQCTIQSWQQPLEDCTHMERWTILLLHECKQQYVFVCANNQSDTQFSLLRIHHGSGDILQFTNRSVNELPFPNAHTHATFTIRLVTDPFETQNRVAFLSADERLQMHNTLEELKACRGRGCTLARYGTSSDFAMTANAPRGVKRKHNITGKIPAIPICILTKDHYD